ncbi:glycosyltransferase [Vibrio gazogenes]|uniref:Glycosyltransferase 2-like domain-containing protein n=1 Tax=Vibrio gazogenes TaxID=687 RepID=A0A1Z2SFE7_VIBGA|nr:glycosyltransferase [Vibrio gazogenes]ASA55902.1 hypothetical protein BSQ33_09495 [Vibrio gazogenes]
MLNKKVCIISPDIIGPIKNGGIGTHCYHLANDLRSQGFDVTLLFTGPLQVKSHEHWIQYYNDLDIKYIALDNIKSDLNISYELHSSACFFLENSFFIYEYLKRENYDFVHFQDWLANGLVSIQAKQTTNYFSNTLLTVTLHSSTQWQTEGMLRYSSNPCYDMKLKWAEQYCVQHCDVAISPSEYMFNWVQRSGWTLSKCHRVIPNCYHPAQNNLIEFVPDKGHLIFFGRLETRKGLEYFLDNIPNVDNLVKISFIGKISLTSEGRADSVLAQKLKSREIDYDIYEDFDSFQAIDFIKLNKGLVVIPSLVDNFPYTVVEMIQNGIPFVCSNVGGIPEMVDEKVLFNINDKQGLSKLINNIDIDFFSSINHLYSPVLAKKGWVELHKYFHRDEKNDSKLNDNLVSICVPYYNYPLYLPLLLASLKGLTYRNIEVIIVNDGSPQPEANDVFERMKLIYSEFYFYSKENSGVGDTRNFAASKATGEYLIFMDSDNIAYPNMVDDFVKAIKKSDSDVVTCHFDAFDENFEFCDSDKVLYKYLPLGPCKESGILENIYGDANFIIKKQVFEALSGFGTERHTSWEDWEFLAKCALEGYRQAVIPEPLFGYRHTEAGFSRNTSLYNNHQRILKCYSRYYPQEIQNLISGYVLPSFYRISFIKKLYLKYKNIFDFFFPVDSSRRKLLRSLIKRVLK